MNILYIGPNESEWAQEHCPGSLAASKWARGFLGGLSKVARVTALTHTYYYPWPKGRRVWSGRDDRLYPDGWDCEIVEYPVLKYVRELWWRFAYAVKARRIIREKKIDVVLFYNCNECWQVPVMRAIRDCGVSIFPIILDGDDPRKDDWGWMKKAARYADGFISMSWWVYQNIPCNIPRKISLHFDGGADSWCGNPPQERKPFEPFTLVHTGALDQWRGLEFMIEIVRRYAKEGVKFIFCGKSSRSALAREFGGNPHVELTGFVSEEKMEEICNSADVFLNVRDPLHPDNILNYPSKLPHYLSFGRPVVSTRLQSLSPDYAQVVHFPENDSVETYIKLLNEIRDWDVERCRYEYDTIYKWFMANKRWDAMTQGLVTRIQECVDKENV